MPRILLVEDNEENQRMMSRRLQRKGYEVVIAGNGQIGVQLAGEVTPDIILMDLSMPIMDGWEATRCIKTNAETAKIPVIALTAHAMSNDRERAFEAGCDDFDTKPVDLPRLLQKIQVLTSTPPPSVAKRTSPRKASGSSSDSGTESVPPTTKADTGPQPGEEHDDSFSRDTETVRIFTNPKPTAPPEARPPGRPGSGSEAVTRSERGHVLIVDDTESKRDLIARAVEREGYSFEFADNGEEALQKLGSNEFDLVLLDIMMPIMDGYEVLKRMKSDTAQRHIPVVVISATGQEATVRCIEMGADDFLTTPVDRTLLRARLNTCIEKKRLRDQELVFRRQLEAEKRRADDLLNAIFPFLVVQELKETNEYKPRRHQAVGVLFCDIVGFTPFCDQHSPEEVVDHLQHLVGQFERIAAQNDVQKIKTIGDAFMGASGLVNWVENPVSNCVRCGEEMIKAASEIPPTWDLRIGVHCGPVVAGIVGSRQYSLDIWGNTVNVASRMEHYADPGTVAVSSSAWQRISHLARGNTRTVDVRGIGSQEIVTFAGWNDSPT